MAKPNFSFVKRQKELEKKKKKEEKLLRKQQKGASVTEEDAADALPEEDATDVD